MKRTFDTESRPLMTREFRDYQPPRRNHVPSPPRVESSPIAAIYPQDLDKTPSCLERVEPPWRVRDGIRDCYEHMDDEDLSDGEKKARKRLLKLCRDLADDYEDELDDCAGREE